ncbi:hypothetical protein BH11GEM1_BH11GEM1_27160 [soil metagenome]
MPQYPSVRRWDIFRTNLDPSVGSEQQGDARPVIVVSNDGFNQQFDMVTVVPITSMEGKKRTPYPFEVVLSENVVTPNHVSIAMPQQIRSIAKERLITRITSITDESIQVRIENRILEHLGIAFINDESEEA